MGEISSSASSLAAALPTAGCGLLAKAAALLLGLLAAGLLAGLLAAAAALLAPGFAGDVAAVDSLLEGLLVLALLGPLLACADLSSSKPAGNEWGRTWMFVRCQEGLPGGSLYQACSVITCCWQMQCRLRA